MSVFIFSKVSELGWPSFYLEKIGTHSLILYTYLYPHWQNPGLVLGQLCLSVP